jgi:hypothetical protein
MIEPAVAASILIVLQLVASVGATLEQEAPETLAFPATALTTQQKIDWLTSETDRAEHAVDAEADRPLLDQREAVYRAVLTRGSDLLRLSKTLSDHLPRLEGRVNEMITKARAGLDRIANARLKIGMDAAEVRRIRGEPNRITESKTAAGPREQWHYGSTVLSFDNGKLVEIRQSLSGD